MESTDLARLEEAVRRCDKTLQQLDLARPDVEAHSDAAFLVAQVKALRRELVETLDARRKERQES